MESTRLVITSFLFPTKKEEVPDVPGGARCLEDYGFSHGTYPGTSIFNPPLRQDGTAMLNVGSAIRSSEVPDVPGKRQEGKACGSKGNWSAGAYGGSCPSIVLPPPESIRKRMNALPIPNR